MVSSWQSFPKAGHTLAYHQGSAAVLTQASYTYIQSYMDRRHDVKSHNNFTVQAPVHWALMTAVRGVLKMSHEHGTVKLIIITHLIDPFASVLFSDLKSHYHLNSQSHLLFSL